VRRRTSSQHSWAAPLIVPARDIFSIPGEPMHTYTDGRHEHGQNFLRDQRIIRQMTDLAAQTQGPILEVGPGRGALTFPLEELGRPLTAVEIDRRLAQRLSRRCGRRTSIVHGDFLQHRLPETAHTIIGNLPFHLTTAILRRLLHHRRWTAASSP